MLVFFRVIILIFAFSTTTVLGQNAFGLGGLVIPNSSTVGGNLRAYRFLESHYCLGPELAYLQSNNEHGTKSIVETNITVHYIFDLTHKVGFYPLGGVSWTHESEQITPGKTVNESAFGINIGGGFHYVLNNTLPFVEYKYVIGPLGDHFIGFGILIMTSGHKD